MTRELLIMRHAKSAWETGAASDFERPLATRGRQAAPRTGQWLRENDLVPDHIVSSPARRARQTAERVCPELGIDSSSVTWDPRIYEATAPTLLQVLADCPAEARRVLLIGHNPGLENLLLYLCPETPVPDSGKILPTAAVARVALPDDWQELESGTGEMLDLL
ncbi:MAG: histidine phosphatase family protein, partial [Candidatus Competibacterales bacterium]|nr:histidine phosphatase family protein [Candidatus Competibacterales bacterium]